MPAEFVSRTTGRGPKRQDPNYFLELVFLAAGFLGVALGVFLVVAAGFLAGALDDVLVVALAGLAPAALALAAKADFCRAALFL